MAAVRASTFSSAKFQSFSVFLEPYRSSVLVRFSFKSLCTPRPRDFHHGLPARARAAIGGEERVERKTVEKSREISTIDEIAANSPNLARVVLKKGKAFLFIHGCPIVYSGAIDRVVGRPPPETGSSVLVQDHAGATIGWGVFNSVSMFRVRLMQTEVEAKRDNSCTLDVGATVAMRVTEARNLRKAVGLPAVDTNVFRLVNSEGDRLSGLVIDMLGPDWFVVSSSAAWTEIRKQEIVTAVRGVMGADVSVTWRPAADMLNEEGWTGGDNGVAEGSPGKGGEGEFVEVLENGVRYLASPVGQKTGFYADQRENRKLLGSLSKGKLVLDLCCYSGGFSLNAAMGGASRVVGVDSSLPAIGLAVKNAELNGFDPASCRFVHADISDYMRDSLARGESWDIVVLDHPKLAPNRKAGTASPSETVLFVLFRLKIDISNSLLLQSPYSEP